MANVTIAGGSDGSPVNISFGSDQNAALAQAALASVNSFIASGADGVSDFSSGTGTLPAIGGDYTGMVGIIGNVGALVQQVARTATPRWSTRILA